MAVTELDLQSFAAFVREQATSGPDLSITELAQEWDAARQRDEVKAAIREGLADIEAGRTRPAREFMAEVREKLDDGIR
ncbi:MAG: hypothetical protein IID44_14470 [Planctomycetes bacterium]|nr:hypothetical protein [Planctomycetota bacterium]